MNFKKDKAATTSLSPYQSLDDKIKVLVLEKQLPLHLDAVSLQESALEFRAIKNLLPAQSKQTYLTLFKQSYNRVCQALKEQQRIHTKTVLKTIPRKLKYNSAPKQFIGYEKIEPLVNKLIINPIRNRVSLIKYSSHLHSIPVDQVKNRSLHNAVVIHGPLGSGKRTLANFISKKLRMPVVEYKYSLVIESIKAFLKGPSAPSSQSASPPTIGSNKLLASKESPKKVEDTSEAHTSSLESKKSGDDSDFSFLESKHSLKQTDVFPNVRGSIILLTGFSPSEQEKDSVYAELLGELIRECVLSNFYLLLAASPADINPLLVKEACLSSSFIPAAISLTEEQRFSLLLILYGSFFADKDLLRLPRESKDQLRKVSAATQSLNNHQLYVLMKRAFLNAFEKDNEVNKSVILGKEHLEEAMKTVLSCTKPKGLTNPFQVSFESLGGLHAQKKLLNKQIFMLTKKKSLFPRIRPNAGAILSGPPGCGKTVLAHAIANESSLAFIHCKGPELVNKYLGESERELRRIFETARASAPSIIFFDEIDALCSRRRSEGDSGASKRLVNQFLTEIDTVTLGRGPEEGAVFVIGATNRPEDLDEAVVRQGRLGVRIEVGLPSEEERKEILKVLLKGVGLWDNVDKVVGEWAVEKMKGWCGADINSFVGQAIMEAVEDWGGDEEGNIGGETFCKSF